MPYLLGIDGTLDKYRKCDEVWRIAVIKFPACSISGTSSLLVALIVFLRLLMVRHPTSYESVLKPLSRIGCIVAWALPLLVSSTMFIVSLPPLYDINIYNTFVAIVNYGLLAAPILLTVVIYVMLLWSLNQQTSIAEATNTQMKALAKMTRGVVAGLIVCNVPGMLYLAYLVTMIGQGKGDDVFTSNIAV